MRNINFNCADMDFDKIAKTLNYNGTPIEYNRDTTINSFDDKVVIKAGDKQYEFNYNNYKESYEHVYKFKRDYERILCLQSTLRCIFG